MADPDRCVVQEGHQVLYRDVCCNYAMDQLTETSPLDIYELDLEYKFDKL